MIIITGLVDPDGAEVAIKSGAWDYVQKPFSKKDVTLQLIRALQYREKKGGPGAAINLKREGIIGSSSQITGCLSHLASISRTNTSVLITGETGTGKELFAQAIHDNSLHSDKNFVIVDCTVLPEKLVESVLFGHEKGAFTGADRQHQGLVKQADGGTLFLDEVGELPLLIQKAFLRVLQEHSFRPVGSKKEETSDFRLVAATNRDLSFMASQGQFRHDLLYRIKTASLELPPLRDRRGDIKDMALYYLPRICKRNDIPLKSFSSEFFEILTSYDWPGNIRELVNAMEEAILSGAQDEELFPKHLPAYIRIKITRSLIATKAESGEQQPESSEFPKSLMKLKDFREAGIGKLEKDYLNGLMALTKGNIKEACSISGLSRARLYALIKKYNISRFLDQSSEN